MSAVVFISVGALLSAHAGAQPAPKPSAPRPAGNAPAPPRKADDRLSDEAELARVVSLYEAGRYRECGAEVERLLDPTGKAPLRQPTIVENARVYWAACLLGAGELDAADAPLRAAIHENPQMKPPDSLVFPQPVVQRFLKVRDSLVNEIRAAEQARIKQAQAEARQREQKLARDRDRMLALEKLARQETLVVRNRRSLAFVPFGVGQIQNRQEILGYTLMASQVLLASLSITAVAVQSHYAVDVSNVQRSGQAVDAAEIERDLATWGTVKRVSFWAFAGLALGGVLQAQLEYVPEFRETRSRELPPSVAPTPVPAPASSAKGSDISALPYFDAKGGGLNVVGRF